MRFYFHSVFLTLLLFHSIAALPSRSAFLRDKYGRPFYQVKRITFPSSENRNLYLPEKANKILRSVFLVTVLISLGNDLT